MPLTVKPSRHTNTNKIMQNLTTGRVIILTLVAIYLLPILYTHPHMIADVWLIIPFLVIMSALFSGLNKQENNLTPQIMEYNQFETPIEIETNKKQYELD